MCHNIQGAVDVDDKAKQQIVALANQLYNFSGQIEEQELELWCRLSHTVYMLGVQQLLAKNQEELQQEYADFVKELSDYVNKEIANFR